MLKEGPDRSDIFLDRTIGAIGQISSNGLYVQTSRAGV